MHRRHHCPDHFVRRSGRTTSRSTVCMTWTQMPFLPLEWRREEQEPIPFSGVRATRRSDLPVVQDEKRAIDIPANWRADRYQKATLRRSYGEEGQLRSRATLNGYPPVQ